MKSMLIPLSLIVAGTAHAQTFQYRCINKTARSEAESTLVADLALGKTSAQLRVLKSSNRVPPNWKLSRGEVLVFRPLRPDENPPKYGYLGMVSKNKVGAPVRIRFNEYDFGDRVLDVAWDIEALPPVDEDDDGDIDEVGRLIGGTLTCQAAGTLR